MKIIEPKGAQIMDFLRKNAEYFENKAREALNEAPKFVLFFAEQSIQLYLKFILAKHVGDFPKTHKLRILLIEVSKFVKNVEKLVEKYDEVIDLIEEAYITTRYFDKEYSIKSAKLALKFLNEFKEVLKDWL